MSGLGSSHDRGQFVVRARKILTVSLYTKVYNGVGREGGGGARIDSHLIQGEVEKHAQKSGMRSCT